MTDCGRVHDWLENKGFTSIDEVIAAVQNDPRTELGYNAKEWGGFWICVERYDFESYYTIDSRNRLYRKNRRTNRFMGLNLSPDTRNAIRSILERWG